MTLNGSVSTSQNDPVASNNSASQVTIVTGPSTSADLSISKSGPSSALPNSTIAYTITVTNNGPATATGITVGDPTPSRLTFISNSGACSTPFPCAIGTLASGQTATILSQYTVQPGPVTSIKNTASVTSSSSDPSPANNSSSTITSSGCPGAPTPISPANGQQNVALSGSLSWSSAGGQSYRVFLGTAGSGCQTLFATTSATSVSYANLQPSTDYEWRVEASAPGCSTTTSSCVKFRTLNACDPPAAPLAGIIAETISGQAFTLQWGAVAGAGRYEVDEATNAAFDGATTQSTTATSLTFTKNVTTAQPFFYRVRAFAACDGRPGPNSPVVRVVVVPVPSPTAPNPNANAPFGTSRLVVQQIFVPGVGNAAATFAARTDSPRVTVTPESGPLPPQGVLLTVTIDPTGLPNGTFTATVIVTVNDGLATGGVAAHGSSTKKTPVSVTLVTPVTPTSTTTPTDASLIIPSVGHLDGFNSQWRSDIRIANVAEAAAKYRLIFTPQDVSLGVKDTTIDVDAGATTALDDVVRSWFGVGSLGEASGGTLEIRPVSGTGKIATDLTVQKTTAVSSRTYNVTGNGTLGQFIPAIPFLDFIGRAAGGQAASILSLQQIAQSDAFRTNLGLVEVTGKPADLAVSVFNAAGVKLREVPISLRGGEQRQINSFLAQQGISLDSGRIEVLVIGGDGRVTAYASVVDNSSGDPLLVEPVQLGAARATKFVLPGVADLNSAVASWRTDLRILNASTTSQTALLTFYPQNNLGVALTSTVNISAGETRALDNVLQSLFQTHDVGGAVHVTTPTESSLVVTGRTYNQTGHGTFGQFIPAVTPAEAVGPGERALQILQVEESVRYRTNLGLAEVTGNPVRVEVTVTIPDSKVSPRLELDLAPNEFRQIGILRELGLDGVYNARIAVRAISGEGRVTAYGSVVDMLTEDPTYVKAQ